MSTGVGTLSRPIRSIVVLLGVVEQQRDIGNSFYYYSLVLWTVLNLMFNFWQRHVVDFYISDFQSGLRALVKTGYGAKVTTYINESTVLNIDPSKKESSPEFLQWLAQRNLSSDDRVMRVKEGYIKEGSTVSVMGVVRRNANVLMIVPPHEPVSTGCQWTGCIIPASIDGIVLSCEDTSNDVIPV
ncbi:hypothetical protein ZIOFF_048842 [Zingiber officinale]|uniref:Uncharacterized protein n=1 Tax=Zingiber officinale TaxID=94328 RepID=A0A8J5FU12_ZINOF|nr:hypothetical protein ZIOFF_048842 [Zingiber officinale]